MDWRYDENNISEFCLGEIYSRVRFSINNRKIWIFFNHWNWLDSLILNTSKWFGGKVKFYVEILGE